ncbi:MAG TPA: hypothetical protein VFZ22_14170 [Pyrinomonadaceae bacterium]|nr:hypothetical protein [Pyrinomonadaceae bacterium]
MIKKLLSVSGLLLGASLIAIVVTPARVSLQPSQNSRQAEKQSFDRTSLEGRVRKEKEKGAKSVTFSAPLVEYADGISLDDALSATVVVAAVTEKHSRQLDSHTIGTFYRLSILETLSEATPQACCLPKDEALPADLPPLSPDETYFLGIGGTITLDGIEVTVKEDFGTLMPGDRYLMFLPRSASGKLSTSAIGPSGVFRINGGGRLESIGKQHRLGRDLEERYQNSLTQLKDKIKKRP